MSNVYSVILAGGSGTRFWPASRSHRPKQVLAIGPGGGEPLIARTARRVRPLSGLDRVLIATAEHLVSPTRQVLPELPEAAFLAEPVARNTAACIGWASSLIHRRDPGALVMVLPSDHHVEDEQGFLECLKLALETAESGLLTTIGLKPTRPETGYGYIAAGPELREGVRKVARFVEKPDRARAEVYAASSDHFWNSGFFLFRTSTMLSAIAAHMPELHAGLERIQRAAAHGPDEERRETERVFRELASVSIDYGVMEKASELAVVPGDFGWSDLGSWHTVWELGDKDQDGNVSNQKAVFVDARDNLVYASPASGRVIALVGVEDLCVVETEDALLVVHRNRAQDVRNVVDELKRRGHPV
jgi:mannose-1-phosphate guanylyltransferase